MSSFRWSALRAISTIVALFLFALLLGSCGSGTTSQPSVSTTGTVTTNMSDPPTCGPPAGQFSHVWVTITKVLAHTSADTSLSPTASGWITLADLTSAPKQLDLLSLASTTCLLNKLGSVSGLPPGSYQQIRILLLSNTPSSGTATPSPNNCSAASAFNCVVLSSTGSVQALQLSSEAQTGIKVPPGQIAGGAINLAAGQAADINIDFNSCASIVQQGNGVFRLKPTLTAGVVSTSSSITGQFVDSSTKNGVPNAIVLLEQVPSGGSSEQIVHAGVADSSGNFSFCPLPAGSYDVVGAAEFTSPSGVTTTYNATITFNVPAGTAIGKIPLLAETGAAGASTLPGTITGQVTSGSTAVPVTFLPFQQATKSSGVVQVIIPVLPTVGGPTPQQPASVMTGASTATVTCPAGNDCANYTLLVPASNPIFATFSSSGTTYPALPASPPVNYTVTAQSATCSPSSVTSGTIIVAAGAPSIPTATNFTLSGCTSP